MFFELYPLRFVFRARDSVHFPAGKPGNVLRGAFGTTLRRLACPPECPGAATCTRADTCAYARVFEPRGAGPSGLADPPRAFVFRAAHLGGCTIEPGREFSCDVHLFDLRESVLAAFVLAFAELARGGLGPRRGRAELLGVWSRDRRLSAGSSLARSPEPLRLDLCPRGEAPRRIILRFLTPTELKAGGRLVERPDFEVLFSRVRDRISTLRALYGPGPLAIDFQAAAERARRIRLTRCDIAHVSLERRSSRTGQVHPLGGFTGEAEYEGDLAEFLPYLRAGQFTGVGRQTVWGKGQISVDVL
ncbi:MAG: CRISPR system precrRNA processing endoribonuclease RAMP protein Cas6 [Acidobacteria bacterium]|nr:CRISPR system precrRNA processing endoribonuclease RAMP protein Cas6 [Acidobacteriota bacterium]